MTEPHDDIDAWLHAHVEPLPPPPGTFTHIRRRARRRRIRQAVVTAASAGAAAAVIVLAVVALPKIAPGFHSGTSPAGNNASASSPAPGHGATATSGASPMPTPTGPTFGPVPANFAPTSATFVDGGTIGWVIGQAGTPGHCYHPYDCTSVARTVNVGQTWEGQSAPVTTGPEGAAGVSQIRFLNTQDGWAFGPQLYWTNDGGQSWTPVSTDGLRVIALETVDGKAFAVWAQCAGTGQDYAADCTQFSLWSSPAGVDDWEPVPGAGSGFTVSGGGTSGSVALVLTSTAGYLIAPDGILFRGQVTGSGAWAPASSSPVPCLPDGTKADGGPVGLLAAGSPGHLALVCPSSAAGTAAESTYTSTDGGRHWQHGGTLPGTSVVMSLAETATSTIVAGTTQGIEYSTGGQSWQPAQVQGSPQGGFGYVGMTTADQGVAVPEQASQHAVWFTTDGGLTWAPSTVTGG